MIRGGRRKRQKKLCLSEEEKSELGEKTIVQVKGCGS